MIYLTEIGRRAKRVFDDDIGFGVKVGLEVPFRPPSKDFIPSRIEEKGREI